MADPSYIPSFFSVQMKLKPQSGMREILVCFCLSLQPRHQPPLVLTIHSSVETEDCAVVSTGMVYHSLRLLGLLFTKAMALTELQGASLSPSSCLPPFLHAPFSTPVVVLSQVSHWLLPISNLSTVLLGACSPSCLPNS